MRGGTTGCCCKIFGVIIRVGLAVDGGGTLVDIVFDVPVGIDGVFMLTKLELRLCLGGGSGMRVEDAGEIERLVVAASLVFEFECISFSGT